MSIALDLVGWSPWLVLPLAAAGGWLIARIGRDERASLPAASAKRMAWLRGLAAAAIIALLLEPVLTIVRDRSVLPVVAVLVDRSGSMATQDLQARPGDRLDEAVVLGLLDPADRPDAPRRADRLLATMAAESGDVAKLRSHASELAALSRELAGQQRMAEALAGVTSAITAGEAARIQAAIATARSVTAAAQAELDAAQASGAAAGSPVARALTELGAMDRSVRALRWVTRVLTPALAGRADVRVLTMSPTLDPLDPQRVPAAPPAGATDPQGALAGLARSWSGIPLGGVLLLGDGRQTAGGDAAPAARALLARGAPVHAVALGDPQAPRDLAIAEVTAPAEVMQGERVPLEVRWRAVGYADAPLELVLLRDGRELERRPVTARDGAWRSDRFEPPAGEPGLAGFQVRIGRRVVPLGGGVWERTWWTDSSGNLQQDRRNRLSSRKPAGQVRAAGPATFDAGGNNILMRITGTVIPPVDGNYIFHIAGDDDAELRLVGDAGGDGRVIAQVPTWVSRGRWDASPAQTSAPCALAAGRPVAIEIWLAQAGGDGFVDVGWTRPDGVVERPLTAERVTVQASAGAALAEERPEASLVNNQASAVVQVHGDPLRVLLIDHTPRWESRYLATLLMRDRRVQVDRRWQLDDQVAAERGVAPKPLLPADPGALERYDAVVLGDIGPSDLAPGDEARLASFVDVRGGFLVLIAGPRAMPGSLGLGKLAGLVPVRPGPSIASDPTLRLALAPAGRRHPITALLEESANDVSVWPLLTPPEWLAGGTVRPGAEALVERADATRTPVLVTARTGAGRILYLGTPEAWRWRDRLGERLHQTMWVQAFRWGLGGRLRGADPRLQAALDTPIAAPGESVELRLRSVGGDGTATPAPEVVIEACDEAGAVRSGTARNIDLAPLGDGRSGALPGQWRTALSGLAPGRWRLRIAGRGAAAGLHEIRELAVRERQGAELADLGTDLPALERLTAAGGGLSAALVGADPIIAKLQATLKPRDERRTAVHPLWDGYLPLLLIAGLLVGEWLMRRRHGLP